MERKARKEIEREEQGTNSGCFKNQNSKSKTFQLIDYLKEKYYPYETLTFSDSFPDYLWDYSDMIPDIAVLSKISGEPLAFFQLVDLGYIARTEGLDSGPVADALHLIRHTRVLYQIPYYLVVANAKKEADSEEFLFFNMINCMQERISFENYTTFATEPLSYNILISNEKNRINRRMFVRRERIIKWITLVVYCLIPTLLLTTLILDAFKIYVITKIRLCMLGLIILSVFLPTIAEISIKDFSVSFKENKKEQPKNKE